MKKPVSIEFLSSGSWVCPPGVTQVIVQGMGGGAGGYGGGSGSTTLGGRSGPGGISAPYLVKLCTVVPNTTYTVTIGAGGTGATGSTTSRDAVVPTSGDGGDTSLGSVFVALGANGSNTGGQFATIYGVTDKSAPSSPIYLTGNKNRAGAADGADSIAETAYTSLWFEAAADGTTNGTSDDGGQGVAGNSSQFGLGGTGGNGGVFGGAAAGNAGDASANTGAGGGSGGGSAKDPGANLPGGNGGDGGSGRLTIMWFE